jgi:hypothetical protein
MALFAASHRISKREVPRYKQCSIRLAGALRLEFNHDFAQPTLAPDGCSCSCGSAIYRYLDDKHHLAQFIAIAMLMSVYFINGWFRPRI